MELYTYHTGGKGLLSTNYHFMVSLGNFLVWGAVSATQIRKHSVNTGSLLPHRQGTGQGEGPLLASISKLPRFWPEKNTGDDNQGSMEHKGGASISGLQAGALEPITPARDSVLQAKCTTLFLSQKRTGSLPQLVSCQPVQYRVHYVN